VTLSRKSKQYIENYNRIYKRVLKEAKRRENDRLLLKATNKSKTIWKIIKSEIGKPNNYVQGITLNIQSEETEDLHKIAELFNMFFCEIPIELLRDNKRNDTMPSMRHRMNIKGCNKSLFFSPITENEVVKVAQSLKNKFTTGYDDIPGAIFKQCIDYLKKQLTNIFNTSLGTGIFPEQLKIAKFIPIRKRGNTRSINNYRPMALLSVFYKLLEKLVCNRIVKFMEL
jgi:hypothetical protein